MSQAADYAQRVLEANACTSASCPCRQSARRGHGLTHCFVHNDPGPSLSVTVKGDKLLVNCQAGCAQKDVIEGLRQNDMWPEEDARIKQAAPEIVAEYDYRDEHGTLLFQALRYYPKGFKQRRPDGNGGWIWRLDGVPQVPYRLPEVMGNPDRVVLIAEGEKDVDRLWAEGVVATCNAAGAGKWTEQHAQYLKGRQVIILPDNDDVGRQHAHKVARSLQGLAASVKWLELADLPPKGDVSDWFDAGHTADEFKGFARRAGAPPAEVEPTKDVFAKDGLGYKFQPAGSDLTLRFTKVTDRSERMPAEFAVYRNGSGTPFVRRSVNLTAASGFPDSIVRTLEKESAGQDINWEEALQRGAELTIQASRNGLVLRMVGGDIERPPSEQWLCDGLVLKGKLNCWLGTGSTGKSTLAKMLATYCRLGVPFLGRPTVQCQSLYLDFEDFEDDFAIVVHDVCRDLGVWPAPEIGWISMRGKRLRDNLDSVGRYIEELGAELLIIDAIAAAGGAGGEHRGWEDIALELDACIGQLPRVTVLGLDHATGEDHKNLRDRVPVKARGSERKYEIYRNQWSLVADQGMLDDGRHVVNWHHTKLNSGPRRKPFVVEILHRPDGLGVTDCPVSASPEAMARLSDVQRAMVWLGDNPGSTLEQIAEGIFEDKPDQKKLDSLRRQLDRQIRRNKVERDAARFYWPSGHPDTPRQLSGPLSEVPF